MRPTAGRVRDALFNSLGARVAGADVLDLFAGTGALGLGALRRKARRVVFVERDPRLAAGVRAALTAAGARGAGEVWRADVLAVLPRLAAGGRRFTLVLLDPPYGTGLLQQALEALADSPVVAPGGLVVAEGHWRDAPRTPPGLEPVREARYGETVLWFFRRRTAPGSGGGL